MRLTALTWAAWRQSFELQRVLEGEKALRAEAARRLADQQRHATLGPRGGAGQAAKLAADTAALEAQIQQHSVQARLQIALPAQLSRRWPIRRSH